MQLKIFKEQDGKYDIDDIANAYYDVTYDNKSEKNKLDLFIPKHQQKNYPLLVFVHSGGFFKSDKRRHLSNILNGLLFDYAVASINFRLNDEVKYDGSRNDIVTALNFLAQRDEINSEKIILWGESYGAYVILDITVNHANELKFVSAGIIDMYCATDLVDFHNYKILHKQELIVRGKENDYHTFGDDLISGMKESSFLENITGKEPPIFIIHGMKDEIIPVKYSIQLEEILKKKGNEFECHYIENGSHGIDNYACTKYNGLIFSFINKCLKGI